MQKETLCRRRETSVKMTIFLTRKRKVQLYGKEGCAPIRSVPRGVRVLTLWRTSSVMQVEAKEEKRKRKGAVLHREREKDREGERERGRKRSLEGVCVRACVCVCARALLSVVGAKRLVSRS